MLSLLKKKQLSHREVFMERYASITTWTRGLTKNDLELAEDVIQDAFIQFTENAPPLDEIKNLDGYIYVLLKNLCLANFRRNSRNRLSQLSVYEYDSAEFAFSKLDFRDQENARDELQKICAFLTIRKNQARTAGVFILRFYHGYFPSEIAKILRTSRPAIDVRLLEARKEIRAFLEDPEDVSFVGIDRSRKTIFNTMPIQANSDQDEFLEDLRSAILNFCEGEHFNKQDLDEFYKETTTSPIKVERLSHLVSCSNCMETVNSIIDLPPLSSRFPTDAIKRQRN